MERNIYKDFWETQTTPLHRNNDTTTYKAYAQELMNIIEYMGYNNGKVLEIGCGNGALYPFFKFDVNMYRGIDFSPSLIKIFRTQHPDVSLVESDASNFIPKEKYELIFGNAVHQHFSKKMLKEHVKNMLLSLTSSGFLLLANVPYKKFRAYYLNGELSKGFNNSNSIKDVVKKNIRSRFKFIPRKKSNIGYWYSHRDITEIVGSQYIVEVYGSNFYPYRVHFCIKKK